MQTPHRLLAAISILLPVFGGCVDFDGPVETRSVCLAVDVPGDPMRIPVETFGTLFVPAGGEVGDEAILLFHGGASDRSIWDGSSFGWGVDNDTSFARALAKAGYAVVTFDRLGEYGQSTYRGAGRSGHQLSTHAMLSQFHQTVEALHLGTYRFTDATCGSGAEESGTPFREVVLGGHSLGAHYARLYATQYQDIQAVMSFAIANGPSPLLAQSIAECQARYPPGSDGYGYGFCPETEGGRVQHCVPLQVYRPATPPDLETAICHRTPRKAAVAEAAGLASGQLSAQLIHQVPAIPMFLMHAQFDATHNAGPNGEDGTRIQGDTEFWQENCACRVTHYVQPDASHLNFFHTSYQDLNRAAIAWLDGF